MSRAQCITFMIFVQKVQRLMRGSCAQLKPKIRSSAIATTQFCTTVQLLSWATRIRGLRA